MDEYIERNQAAICIQFKEDNIDDVIDWLIRHNFQYSYDEIKSAGHLIVYGVDGTPTIVGIGWWIVMRYDNITVMSDEVFKKHFERRSVS